MKRIRVLTIACSLVVGLSWVPKVDGVYSGECRDGCQICRPMGYGSLCDSTRGENGTCDCRDGWLGGQSWCGGGEIACFGVIVYG